MYSLPRPAMEDFTVAVTEPCEQSPHVSYGTFRKKKHGNNDYAAAPPGT